jgi:hypothetical protein
MASNIGVLKRSKSYISWAIYTTIIIVVEFDHG